MGIFSKFAAALVAIPASVLGGMTTFLFGSVAVSGIRIISTIPFTRRVQFILTASMSLGYGATLVPTWFSYVFTYSGNNHAKAGLLNAIVLLLETGFAVTTFVAVILNLLLDEEDEENEEEEVATLAGDGDDAGETVEFRDLDGLRGVERRKIWQVASRGVMEAPQALKRLDFKSWAAGKASVFKISLWRKIWTGGKRSAQGNK